MIVPILVIGLSASILTELLKLFPALSATDERKRIMAFIVSFIIALIYLPATEETLNPYLFIIGVLGATFVIYKAIVQTVVESGRSLYCYIRMRQQTLGS